MPRSFDRAAHEVRPLSFQRNFTNAAGSVLASFGDTRVLCTAVAIDGVPPFLQGKRQGWMTAEYSMLPSSVSRGRKQRDRGGKVDGRSVEIQRLIGRALRSVVDLSVIGERTVWVDCDVIQADGGTRTASISGAWVALCDLFKQMDDKRLLREWPLRSQLAAVSVGLVDGQVLCDLDYVEDSGAGVDMNLVKNSDGEYVEVGGGGEGMTFSRDVLESMLAVGDEGLAQIFAAQKAALAD
ncbi:Ribonuclease PH [Planctomycetes bacterium Pla163]|uniref:Ribonuclease PH n=1 Tax=Rohdeia mirabilis TaxID=2528008 RepID=A0A518D3V9_9BACT|nr:Ribonuclease PH [Planctomycetes bacterium Pla163]